MTNIFSTTESFSLVNNPKLVLKETN